MKYSRASHVIYNLSFHLILTSKYRKPYFYNLHESFLKRILSLAAHRAEVKMEKVEIMPDHIHLFLRCSRTTVDVSKMVKTIKGFSSYIIRKKYAQLKKFKAFWSPTYFIESIGNISEKTIKKYIDNQKVNVKPNYRFRSMIKKPIRDNTLEFVMNDRRTRRFEGSIVRKSFWIFGGLTLIILVSATTRKVNK